MKGEIERCVDAFGRKNRGFGNHLETYWHIIDKIIIYCYNNCVTYVTIL